ncbi:gbh [Symbiodinium necroappetens]|uniref:Gbh protein n=1 Tax=Symbiodinium necroappetens TaxID=1628268 RepID=A0A812N3D6_9DINO|nr:gbh [Symbiodinium necroappetens]
MARRLVVVGGDHTLSYPVIKAVAEKFGPVVLVHFDSHLDTFPPMYGQHVWHGAPFRNCWEEGLLAKDGSTHIGIRATTYSAEDFHDSENMGIATLTAEDVHERGVPACVEAVWNRWRRSGNAPVYLSVDIDVLDPSVAPGTGTPEPRGSRNRRTPTSGSLALPLAALGGSPAHGTALPSGCLPAQISFFCELLILRSFPAPVCSNF